MLRALQLLIIIVMACLRVPAMPASDADVNSILKRLDSELDNRLKYIDRRQAAIDSLEAVRRNNPADLKTIERLGELYTSFNNDSALSVYRDGYSHARKSGMDSIATRFRISRGTLLPLAGFMSDAETEFTSINPDSLSLTDRIHYYSGMRQMYSFMSAYFHRFPAAEKHYADLTLKAHKKLISLLPANSNDSLLYQGEYYFLTGELTMGEALISELLTRQNEDNDDFAKATHILADIARRRGNTNNVVYYLALSAISDTRRATREVTSLQELGQMMFEREDIERAHEYLYTALRNAVECNAETRMIQIAEATPLIESVHRKELDESRRGVYIFIAFLAMILLLLIITMIVLRMKMRQMKQLQIHFQQANATKEEYISQFLNLCSIYMDKLKQFCSIANRKITAGKVDELFQLTKSGKFVENQSKEFYEIFDNAFIHIYPGFVDSVNSLLRPECRISLEQGEQLNTDLRILAFMRLGISDSARIAQILNYSVNTIYAYRNKLKNKAINRETFEADIQSI